MVDFHKPGVYVIGRTLANEYLVDIIGLQAVWTCQRYALIHAGVGSVMVFSATETACPPMISSDKIESATRTSLGLCDRCRAKKI